MTLKQTYISYLFGLQMENNMKMSKISSTDSPLYLSGFNIIIDRNDDSRSIFVSAERILKTPDVGLYSRGTIQWALNFVALYKTCHWKEKEVVLGKVVTFL